MCPRQRAPLKAVRKVSVCIGVHVVMKVDGSILAVLSQQSNEFNWHINSAQIIIQMNAIGQPID